METYKQGLENIKKYLADNEVKVDNVIRWQGGFKHEGSDYGLDVIATVEINGKEERYCVPRYLVKKLKSGVRLKYLKIDV